MSMAGQGETHGPGVVLRVTKHIQGRAPNGSLLLRSDPRPPANEHFPLLDSLRPPLWCLLGGLARAWNEAGHRHGVGCSSSFSRGGAGVSLSLGHRGLCCNKRITLMNLPHLFLRANVLPCKKSNALFLCLAWLEAMFEGVLEKGSHHLMLGPGDGADPPLG